MFVIVVSFVVVLVGCGGNSSAEQKPATTPTAPKLSEFEKKQNLEKANLEASRSKEIPVGNENFAK